MAESNTVKKSSPALVALAWLIVIVPTAWGLNYTVQNAMKLFTSTPAASAPAK
jgi:hypothetical protein